MVKLYKYMQRNNPHTWVLLPLAIITDFPATEQYHNMLDEIESQFIRQLDPPLNSTKGTRRSYIFKKPTHSLPATRKPRPLRYLHRTTKHQRLLKSLKENHIFNTLLPPVTTFSLRQGPKAVLSSYKLHHIIKALMNSSHRHPTITDWQQICTLELDLPLQPHNHFSTHSSAKETGIPDTRLTLPIFISWSHGRCLVTKLELVITRFGLSTVRYNNKTMSLKHLVKTIRSKRPFSGRFHFTDIVHSNNSTDSASQHLAHISKDTEDVLLATHMAHTLSLTRMTDLHIKADTLAYAHPRKAFYKEALECAMKYKYGFCFKPNITLTIPFSDNIDRRLLLSHVKRMISQAQILQPIQQHLLSHEGGLRMVFTKNRSIRQQLSNYKTKICNNYNPTLPPKCICCDIPSYLRSTLPDEAYQSLQGAKHIAFKSHDFTSFLDERKKAHPSTLPEGHILNDLHDAAHILSLNANNTPQMNYTENEHNTLRLFSRLTSHLVLQTEHTPFPVIIPHKSNDGFKTLLFSQQKLGTKKDYLHECSYAAATQTPTDGPARL